MNTKKKQDPVYYVTAINHHASITCFKGVGAEQGVPEFSEQTIPSQLVNISHTNTFSMTNWLHFTNQNAVL